ncbi:MAG TPA: gamma-glutamyl-gamma-aminobutyrate hydrolase family protein [Polyangiaceae bacterium]
MKAAHVLVVQHVAHETPGLVEPALRAKDIERRFVRPFAGDRVPEDAADAVGLVVLGGPMGVYESERYPHLRDEMRLIERTLRAGCPVLGICLGSQLLAHVLGAAVTKGQRKEVGWHRVTLGEAALSDPLFKTVESSFVAFHWHGDRFDLPKGATHLVGSELTQNQAFRYGSYAYGLLLHLELDAEMIAGMVQAFPADLEDTGQSPEGILEGAREHLGPLSERGSRVLAGWADLVAAYRDETGS